MKLKIKIFCACTLRYFLIIPQSSVHGLNRFHSSNKFVMEFNIKFRSCEVHRVKYTKLKLAHEQKLRLFYANILTFLVIH